VLGRSFWKKPTQLRFKVWCHQNKTTSFSLPLLLILVFSLESCQKNLHCNCFEHFHLWKDDFFLLLFCVYVLLLVEVVLFSLNWNISIVYNFYSYLSPCRCFLHTYFACVLPTCLLRTCSTYLLHVANLLPHHLFLPPPPMTTFAHLPTSTITT
jgi:hypothetical protein